MSKIWLVQLQRHGSSWNPVEPQCKVVCACDSEEAAHKVGQDLAWFYNHPFYGWDDSMAGVIYDICYHEPEYRYAVLPHEGEWI